MFWLIIYPHTSSPILGGSLPELLFIILCLFHCICRTFIMPDPHPGRGDIGILWLLQGSANESLTVVKECKSLGIHIGNKMDWMKITEDLYKKGQSHQSITHIHTHWHHLGGNPKTCRKPHEHRRTCEAPHRQQLNPRIKCEAVRRQHYPPQVQAHIYLIKQLFASD